MVIILIFHDLKREYEKGKKQGAVEELERIYVVLEQQSNINYFPVGNKLYVSYGVLKEFINNERKRLGELK